MQIKGERPLYFFISKSAGRGPGAHEFGDGVLVQGLKPRLGDAQALQQGLQIGLLAREGCGVGGDEAPGADGAAQYLGGQRGQAAGIHAAAEGEQVAAFGMQVAG